VSAFHSCVVVAGMACACQLSAVNPLASEGAEATEHAVVGDATQDTALFYFSHNSCISLVLPDKHSTYAILHQKRETNYP
jgi:hypothetical protein